MFDNMFSFVFDVDGCEDICSRCFKHVLATGGFDHSGKDHHFLEMLGFIVHRDADLLACKLVIFLSDSFAKIEVTKEQCVVSSSTEHHVVALFTTKSALT